MDIRLDPIKINDLRPMREIVFIELKKAIFDGRIKEDEHLVESKIAHKMNVSRTPVREALRQLEAEGLVENIPRRGAVVKEITTRDVEEIYDIREVLEGLMVRLSCKNRTEEDLKKLKKTLTLMEKAMEEKDHRRYLELHENYNNIILESSKNEKLKGMMKGIYENLICLRSVSLYREDRKLLALEEHKEIVELIEARNEVRAEEIARKHILKAKEAFSKNLLQRRERSNL